MSSGLLLFKDYVQQKHWWPHIYVQLTFLAFFICTLCRFYIPLQVSDGKLIKLTKKVLSSPILLRKWMILKMHFFKHSNLSCRELQLTWYVCHGNAWNEHSCPFFKAATVLYPKQQSLCYLFFIYLYDWFSLQLISFSSTVAGWGEIGIAWPITVCCQVFLLWLERKLALAGFELAATSSVCDMVSWKLC